MKFGFLCALILLSLMIYSCQNVERSKSGIEIKFIKRGIERFVDNSVLIMNFQYKDENGRHLSDSTTRNLPLYMPYYKAAWDTLGIFYQTLSTCHIGDSAHFSLTAHEFYVKTFGEPIVPKELNLEDDSKINFFMGISSQMAMDDFYAWQDSLEQQKFENYINSTDERNTSQGKQIDQLLAEQGLTAFTTKSGLRYVVTQEGKGPRPNTGDLITINFHGTLLNGHVFGSSIEEGETPFQFEFGRGEVIEAWEEATAMFKEGTKAILLVPSDLGLGYMPRYDIPANSILRYEFEILAIKSTK